ncbi:MAG: hypothetical protein O7A04_11430, partial [Acidobacteria bacterium]|nr:hypothetical protein [Acidobacteriota bacterium]
TARVGSVTAITLVTVRDVCPERVPFDGSPAKGTEIQSFDVKFVAGTDGVKRAEELAAFLGFSLMQVSQDGFSATLKPKQASAVSCEPDVASMTYL